MWLDDKWNSKQGTSSSTSVVDWQESQFLVVEPVRYQSRVCHTVVIASYGTSSYQAGRRVAGGGVALSTPYCAMVTHYTYYALYLIYA